MKGFRKLLTAALVLAMAAGLVGIQSPAKAKALPVEASGSFTPVWVNGKDVKAKGDTPASLKKTATTEYYAMYSGGKLNVLVTTASYKDSTDFKNLIDEKGKPRKDMDPIKNAPDVKVKLKEGTLTLQSGKKAGDFNVWVYETKKIGGQTVVIDDTAKGVHPVYYTGKALMANKAIVLTDTKGDSAHVDKTKKSISKLTLLPGQSAKLYVYNKGEADADKSAAYTVTADSKNPTDAAKKVTASDVITSGDDLTTRAVTFTIPKGAGSDRGETSKFTITNVESQQKATIALTVVKPTITGQKEVDVTSGDATVAYKIMVGKTEWKDLDGYRLEIVAADADQEKAVVQTDKRSVKFVKDKFTAAETEITLKVQMSGDSDHTELATLKVKVKNSSTQQN